MKGYGTPLVAVIDHVIAESFAGVSLRRQSLAVADMAELNSALAEVL